MQAFGVADLFKERRLRWALDRHEHLNDDDKLRSAEYEPPSSTTPRGAAAAALPGAAEAQVTNGTGNRIC